MPYPGRTRNGCAAPHVLRAEAAGTGQKAPGSSVERRGTALASPPVVFPVLGSVVDFLHALLMVAWVAGLPLLFWHRYPRLTRWYAVYAVVFIVLNQASRLFLGECFLTTIARFLWEHGGAPPRTAPGEWFTVRLAMMVFHLTPSHRSIKLLSELLILVTAVGMLWSTRRGRKGGGAHPSGRMA